MCFMYGTVNNEVYYKNLKEIDREIAYFSLRESKEDKEYYYPTFPDPNKDILLTYNMFDTTPNSFEDIRISDLSIDILNFIYFEYFLFKQIKSFKEEFNSLIDMFSKTKKHQLMSLENEFKEIKIKREESQNNEQNIEGIDYAKFYDLIDTSQIKINEFIDSKFNFIKANNKNVALISKKTREQALLKVIEKANLELFYKFEDWLIKNEYLDENLNWFKGYGKKSTFMRFYLKCIEHSLIKRGAWDKLTRRLSDIYKIDGVNISDYSKKRCEKAKNKDPNEFQDLDDVKSQHNLNLKNN